MSITICGFIFIQNLKIRPICKREECSCHHSWKKRKNSKDKILPQNSVKYTILQYLHVHWQEIAQKAQKIAQQCLHVFLTMHFGIEKHFSNTDHSFWCGDKFSCVEKRKDQGGSGVVRVI